MAKQRNPTLRRRFNKDGTVVLLCKGRVVFKTKDLADCAHFMRGWNREA